MKSKLSANPRTITFSAFHKILKKLNCVFTHEELKSSYGIWKCWFLRRGENRRTRRKTSRSKRENQQQTQPTHGVDGGIWTLAMWEASALTTAPPLLPWTKQFCADFSRSDANRMQVIRNKIHLSTEWDFVFEKFPEENESKIVYFYSVIYEFSPHRQDVHWTLSWHKWTDSEYCSRCLATVMRTPLGSSVNPPIHSSRPRESLLCDKKSQNSTRHQKTSIKPLRTRHKQHAIERRSRYVTLRW